MLRYLADLALPPLCAACHAPIDRHGLLCPSCWSGIAFLHPPVCDRLGLPLPFAHGGEMISSAALANPPVFDRARAAARYEGIMRELIHDLKFRDRHEGLALFGRLMAAAARQLTPAADIITPIPLSRLRLAARRFNQAALLASALGRETGTPVALMALRRTRRTVSQVGLSRAERRKNVGGAFAVAPGQAGRIEGRRVLLVDDVITTGATADACAAVLKAAGAQAVDVVALARTVGEEDGLADGF